MAFHAKKFLKTKFIPRTEDVPVPDMKEFFEDDAGEEQPPVSPFDKGELKASVPIWKVRGLTGHELGRAAEAAEKNKNMSAIIEALSGQASKEKAEALKNILGIGSAIVPADIAKRIEHLVIGSVDPVCTPDLAVRICEVFPVEFYQITNKIMQLTGQGQMPGKQPPSGETEKSAPVSLSVIPGGDSSTK